MKHIFEANGLPFFSEREILLRESIRNFFTQEMKAGLREENSMWTFHYIEAPILTPQKLINLNYTTEDVWFQANSDMVLRPETTPGSYAYACHLINNQLFKPPVCVWQAGKSFRKEQDQPTKHMRLKEFYQQEFQCIFAADTANDYMCAMIPKVEKMIKGYSRGLPTRVIDSDRLPSYSRRTVDIEINNGDKWMEVCSISLRTDFPMKATFTAKNKVIEKELLVLEVAIGLDRMVYCWQEAENENC